MPDRRSKILRLYATRHDHLPEPVKRTDAPAGFVHRMVAREVCPDCFGESPGRVGCESCRGRGFVEVLRVRDPYAVTRVQPYGFSQATVERARSTDAQIARLEAQLAPPPVSELDAIEEANRHPYLWEKRRREMYLRFDYRALDTALELLHWKLPGVAPMSARGLAYLDPLMPDPIRAPAAASDPVSQARGRYADPAARLQRDRQVRRWVLVEEMPVQWVAAQVGLSVAHVNRIVAGSNNDEAPDHGRRSAAPGTFESDVRTRAVDGKWDEIPHRGTHRSPKPDEEAVAWRRTKFR